MINKLIEAIVLNDIYKALPNKTLFFYGVCLNLLMVDDTFGDKTLLERFYWFVTTKIHTCIDIFLSRMQTNLDLYFIGSRRAYFASSPSHT